MATLDDLMSKAKELADSVGKVTGELVDDSRTKLQEMKLSSELKDAYERLGSVTYDSIKTGIRNQALLDLVVSEIDAIHQSLEALKSRAPETSEKYCPQCGTTNGRDAVFCTRCGAPLAPAPAAEAEQPAAASEGSAPEEAPGSGE